MKRIIPLLVTALAVFCGCSSPRARIITGSVNLPQGVSTYTVSGLNLPAVPVQIIPTIVKPAGGGSIYPNEIKGTTSNAFTVDLSGLTDSTNYVLQYQITIP